MVIEASMTAGNLKQRNIAKNTSPYDEKEAAREVQSKEDEESVKLERIGSFPHPFRCRISPLADKRHQGIVNLVSFLLVSWCLTHMVNDYKRTGIFLDLTLAFTMLHGFTHMLFYTGCMIVFSGLCSILFEMIMLTNIDINKTEQSNHTEKKARIVDVIVICAYSISQTVLLTLPLTLALFSDMSPVCRGAFCAQTFVFAMKMHSYFMTNRYMRKHFHSNDNIHVVKDRYAKFSKQSLRTSFIDLTADYILFMISPTLVYEPNFPRSSQISFIEFFKQIIGFITCCLVLYVAIQKYMLPQIESIGSFNVAEHVFFLAVPTLFFWMVAFYAIFHCLLNALAEISRFEDREFYLEWWDSTSMTEFWKLWNRAVYKWMCRHVYLESMRQVRYFNKTIAAISTYVVTALLHEYLLGVAFAIFKPWFFTMIVAQIPFLYAVERFKGTRFGNIIMWLGFSAGLPILELSYIYAYVKKDPSVVSSVMSTALKNSTMTL
jgi:hypothetical protein